MTLQRILTEIGHDIADKGTTPHRPILEAMAEAARDIKPGAAAALTDWDAPEVVRLRAYSVVADALLTLDGRQRRTIAHRLVWAAGLALAA